MQCRQVYHPDRSNYLIFCSQVTQRRENQRRHDHTQLLNNLQESTKSTNAMHATVKRGLADTSQQYDGIRDNLSSLKSTTESTQSSVMSLRSIGEQLARFIGSFRVELRDLLRRVVQGNLETYSILLVMQRDIAAIPTPVLESAITITDALDRVHRLPSDHFCNWEVCVLASGPFYCVLTQFEMVDTFIRHKFTGLPGQSNIDKGQYSIVDERRKWAVIPKERWSKEVFPGALLSMAVVLTELQISSEGCPRDPTHRTSASDHPNNGPTLWYSSVAGIPLVWLICS